MRQHVYGPGMHIAFDDGKVKCPFCKTTLTQPANDKWDKAIMKNKRGYTTTICQCGKRVGLAYCMVKGLTAFVIRKHSYYKKRADQHDNASLKRNPDYKSNNAMRVWNRVGGFYGEVSNGRH